MKRITQHSLFILLIALILAGGWYTYGNKQNWHYKNILSSKDNFIKINDTHSTAKLIFVGDIMLSRSVGKKMAKESDWRWPFLKIGKWLSSADITFGNLEGPISDKGRNVGSVYSFRDDPRSIEGLKYAGFDVVSVANNHMSDWTSAAFEDTLVRLKQANIAYIGGGMNATEAYRPFVKNLKGTRFCFFGYTDIGPRSFEASDNQSGMAFLDIDTASNDIEKYRSSCDLIIVSIHFGEEYKKQATQRQKTIVSALAQAGADLIIGHHPHVIGEVATLPRGNSSNKNTFVFYSLGNFVFDQLFSKATRQGIALAVEVRDKQIVSLVPREIYINNDFQPELVSETK